MAIPGLVEIGTSTDGHAILNQGMITRTPNGDLYASCGNMGQNHDLSVGNGQPIIIWYSNDDGATWVVSKTIYVDKTFGTDNQVYGWKFGGGGNGVCIACDSEGDVKITFAIRKVGNHYQTPDVAKDWWVSLNTVAYLHGKHGAWGELLSIFYITNFVITDALPKVTSLAVDSNNLPHILFEVGTYGGGTDYLVYYLNWPGSGPFDYTLIWIDSYWVARSRMVIDGNDTVHVTLLKYTDEKCYYKQKPSGGGWSSSVWIGMDSSTWYYGAAIAVDKDNTLHLAMFGTGQYRQRSSAGVWSSIESFIGTGYQEPSISISQDGIIHIAVHKVYGNFYVRKREGGVWSSEENWTEGSIGWGVCMLHSFFPIWHSQHVCILESGWAFHWRPGHYTSYYKPGGVFVGATPGFIWDEDVNDDQFRFIDEHGSKRGFLGEDLGEHGTPGYTWFKGAYIHTIAGSGHERRQLGALGDAEGITGMWIEGTNLHWGDEAGDERYTGGTWILGSSKLGIDTVA